MNMKSQRSGLNRRPLNSQRTSTSHSLYSSKPAKGGRVSPERAPNQPPYVQLRATVAGFFAGIREWFREATNGPGASAFLFARGASAEPTQDQIDAFVRAQERRLTLIRGGAR